MKKLKIELSSRLKKHVKEQAKLAGVSVNDYMTSIIKEDILTSKLASSEVMRGVMESSSLSKVDDVLLSKNISS